MSSISYASFIRNLFRARVLDATAERLLLDWEGLVLEAPPQPAAIGSVVAAYIQPEDIRVLYPDRPVGSTVHHNRVSGVILRNEPILGARILRVGLPNGHSVEVRFRIYTYAPLRLEAGQPVEVSMRKEALVILQH